MAKTINIHYQILQLAFPMLIAGISTPLLGMVDTAVVGHLEHPYFLGAVALGAMIFNFLFWSIGFLRMSSTALVARASGQGDQLEECLVLFRGLLLAILLGILFVLCQNFIAYLAFQWLESSEEVLLYCREYFDIRIWSAPATLANYVLLGWFLGKGKALVNVYLVVLGNVLNIFLDILFVVYFEWQVAGVAWATVIAEYMVLIGGLFILIRQGLFRQNQVTWLQLLDLKKITVYLKFNRDIFFRTLFLLICFSYFTISSAKFGENILAANALLMNLQTFMAYVMDSVAHAVEVLVGKHYFKRKQKMLHQFFRASLLWSFVSALAFTIFYSIFGEWIISLLTDISVVQQTASEYMLWLILSPLISVWSYWFDGAFIGANQAKYMRNTMMVSMMMFFVMFFSFQFAGNHGLWAALMGFMLVRAISMGGVAWRKQLWLPRV